MEEMQLDFNAPLLSVRRFSSTSASTDGENGNMTENSPPNRWHSLLSYNSDLKLGQVTEPVAVPFLWEQIPGRPKGGSGPQPQPPEEPPITPKLPPGRILSFIQRPSEKQSEDQNVLRPQTEASPSDDNVSNNLESLKEGINEKEDSDLESGEDAYSDALDTLSQTESLSLNCSVSGLSGSDGPDVKPSGTFSTDPQTRDFMMSRFLPAAKAMVLYTPQYASRKQLVVLEQPEQVNKVASRERRPPANQYGLNTIPHYGQCKEEEESEDEDGAYADSDNISAKACGLFPRFCLKNSLCPLNPVPGMKVRSQAPMSSAAEVSRLAKTTSMGSQGLTVNKHAWNAVYKHKLDFGIQSPKLYEVENKLTGETNEFTYSSELHTTDGSSPYSHSRGGGISPYSCSRGGGISPYRNEALQSPFHEGAGFLGIPEEVENFKANRFNLYNKDRNKCREVLYHQRNKRGSGPVSPTVEKTLYIDSVDIVEIPDSNFSSLDTMGEMDSAGENVKTLLESREVEGAATAVSLFEDIKCLNVSEGGGSLLKLKAPGSIDAKLPYYSDISHLRGQADTMEGFRLDGGLDQESRSLECSKVPTSGNLDMNNHQIIKTDDQRNSNVSSLQSSLPPPLPKSPSESWLGRTLPSISSRNPFSHSYLGTQFHPKKQDPKKSSTGTKWETIVKTSNLHHDHVRYSEELITHVSQQSKT